MAAVGYVKNLRLKAVTADIFLTDCTPRGTVSCFRANLLQMKSVIIIFEDMRRTGSAA